MDSSAQQIITLQRQVAVLTEAVTMLLNRDYNIQKHLYATKTYDSRSNAGKLCDALLYIHILPPAQTDRILNLLTKQLVAVSPVLEDTEPSSPSCAMRSEDTQSCKTVITAEQSPVLSSK